MESLYGSDPHDWFTAVSYKVCICCPWSSISKHWKSVCNFVHFKDGNGLRVSFWHSIWVGSRPLKDVFPRIFSSFWDSDTRSWNVVVTRNVVTQRALKEEEMEGFPPCYQLSVCFRFLLMMIVECGH